jgi:hypothetical protein
VWGKKEINKMKGIRFYEEIRYKGHKKEESRGTVAAVIYENVQVRNGVVLYDAISGLYDEPNAPVCSSGVSMNYLQDETKRVSEERAREIHPKLFERLDE